MSDLRDEAALDAQLRAAIEAQQDDYDCGPRVLTRFVVIAEYSGVDDTSHFNWTYSDHCPPWVIAGMLDWCMHRLKRAVYEVEEDGDE